MSADLISRIIGMLVLAVAGTFFGLYLATQFDGPSYTYAAIALLVGALMGLVVTPYVTVRPFLALRKRIRQAPA
ncbi:MAG: hypothetical protein PVG25_09220, partial [Anaerolineae bacterium]